MRNQILSFLSDIRAANLQPPDYIEPMRIYRFPGQGKGPGNRAAWCIYFSDYRGGSYGDWSTGLKTFWHPRRREAQRSAKTPIYIPQHNRISRAQSARIARDIWDKASPAPRNHRYIVKKQIQPFGARIFKDSLILPLIDSSGNLSSLQFISPSGDKKLLSGGRKKGCFIPVNPNQKTPSCVVVCEGWATGCSLAENQPTAIVLAAVDAGNLKPVAMLARRLWPKHRLIVAGDDDRNTPGNPGITKATAAALAANAQLALPQWPGAAPKCLSDFNDLAIWLTMEEK